MLTTVQIRAQFGVAELDEAGEVVSLVEKPSARERSRAGRGLHLHPRRAEAVRQLRPVGPRELEITRPCNG